MYEDFSKGTPHTKWPTTDWCNYATFLSLMFLSRFVVMLRKVLGVYSVKKKKQSYVMFITGKKKNYTGHCKIRFLSLEISVFLLSLFLCLSFSLTVNGFRGTISINLPNWSNKWLLTDSPTRRCYRLHNELRPAIPHPHHVCIDFQSSSNSILHNQYQTGASI